MESRILHALPSPIVAGLLGPPVAVNPAGEPNPPVGLAAFPPPVVATVELTSVALSTYHGYKRNNSLGWALWWGFMGGLFPVITPVIAFAQGFGKRAGGGGKRRRR